MEDIQKGNNDVKEARANVYQLADRDSPGILNKLACSNLNCAITLDETSALSAAVKNVAVFRGQSIESMHEEMFSQSEEKPEEVQPQKKKHKRFRAFFKGEIVEK